MNLTASPTPDLARRVGRGAVLLRAFVVACVAASSLAQGAFAGELDVALVEGEGVRAVFEANVAAADRLLARRVEGEKTSAEAIGAELDRLKTSVRVAFVPDAAAASAAAALEATSGDDATSGARSALVELARAEQRLAASDQPDRAAALERERAAFEARQDRGAIEELAGLMARPALARETALTAQRLDQAITAAADRGREALSRADESALAAEIDALFAATRREESSDPLVSRRYAEAVERARLVVALARLDAADVAALLAFYRSDVGTAKRAALVSSFARTTEAATRAALVGYLGRKP